MNKRDFLKVSVAAGVTAALTTPAMAATADTPNALQNMTGDAVPISVDERKARVAKAQRLMQANGVDALVIEAGSALVYFTGVRWWRSERFTGAVIPAEGEFAILSLIHI